MCGSGRREGDGDSLRGAGAGVGREGVYHELHVAGA